MGDRKLERIPEKELARFSAAVLTGRPAPELMTCEELVALGRYPYTGRLGILSEEDRAVVQSSMEMTETDSLRNEDFTRISDGQRQRILLARAICQQPKLLLLDEPTSFLDIRHKLEFLLLLRELAEKQNIAVLLSLHELDLAKRIPDRILCLKNGRVDREGTPEEIFRDDYIRRLFDVEEKTYAAVYGEEGASA
jgi:iron complex transport system ATP-binding protein